MQLFHAELRSAIGQGDHCALCRLVADADRSHMLSFLREHGSDPMVLEPIYAAWGFCAWHTWALALMEDGERGGVLAMALLADDLLRHLEFIADASKSASSTSLPIPPSPGPDSNCEMCRAMSEEERYWVRHLIEPQTYPANDLAELPRFCEPHLQILAEAHEARTHISGRWGITLRTVLSRRASHQARDAISLLPLADDTGDLDQAVARACGIRELTAHFSHAGDALAPLDDDSSRTLDRDAVECVVCAAEISAANAACARLLAEHGTAGIALPSASGLCHGHQWLIADMTTSAEVAGGMPPHAAEPSVAAQSICVICHACRDAVSKTLRAGAGNVATGERDTGCLCLAHWSAAEGILDDHGREAERIRMRHAQCRRLEVAREDLRRYLDYFSVSTRDPGAPPPGTFAWRQALTLLVGMRPQGQCRARGDS